MDTTRYTDLELKVIDELETSIDPVLMNEQEQWTEFVRIAHFVIGIEAEEVQEIYKKWQFDKVRDNISEISKRLSKWILYIIYASDMREKSPIEIEIGDNHGREKNISWTRGEYYTSE